MLCWFFLPLKGQFDFHQKIGQFELMTREKKKKRLVWFGGKNKVKNLKIEFMNKSDQ